jgi:hypothetical protein
VYVQMPAVVHIPPVVGSVVGQVMHVHVDIAPVPPHVHSSVPYRQVLLSPARVARVHVPPDIGALIGQFDALGVPPAPAVPPMPPPPLAPPMPPVFRMHCQSRRPARIVHAHVSVP